MKLSEKQALVMFDVLKWSLKFVNGVDGYSPETLLKIVNEIMAQQSEKIIELDK